MVQNGRKCKGLRARAVEPAVFAREAGILPGVASLPLPGRAGLRVASGGEDPVIFGDAAIAAPVQFLHPEARVIFDIDPALAAETRARLFDMAATDGLLVAGNHAPFPAFGRVVVRSGEG